MLFSAVPCSAGEKDELFSRVTVEEFYNYDKKAPLNAEEEKVKETNNYIRYHITYNSAHDKKVTAILTVPKKGAPPYPVIVFQHGMSESKDNEQVQFGTRILLNEGYAVFSIDAEYQASETKRKEKSLW